MSKGTSEERTRWSIDKLFEVQQVLERSLPLATTSTLWKVYQRLNINQALVDKIVEWYDSNVAVAMKNI